MTNLVQELEGLVNLHAGSNFPGYVPLVSKNSYPIIVYSVADYIPHLPYKANFLLQIYPFLNPYLADIFIPQSQKCANQF